MNTIIIPISGSLSDPIEIQFITGSIDVIYFPMSGGNEEISMGDNQDNLIQG